MSKDDQYEMIYSLMRIIRLLHNKPNGSAFEAFMQHGLIYRFIEERDNND